MGRPEAVNRNSQSRCLYPSHSSIVLRLAKVTVLRAKERRQAEEISAILFEYASECLSVADTDAGCSTAPIRTTQLARPKLGQAINGKLTFLMERELQQKETFEPNFLAARHGELKRMLQPAARATT